MKESTQEAMDRAMINVAKLPWAILSGFPPHGKYQRPGMVDVSPKSGETTIYLTNLMLDNETKVGGIRLLCRAMKEGGLVGLDLAQRLLNEHAIPQEWIEMALGPLVLGSYLQNFKTGDTDAFMIDLDCNIPELKEIRLNEMDFTRLNPVLRIRNVRVQHATAILTPPIGSPAL